MAAEQKNDWHECGWREERKQILSMHLAARRNRKARLGETEREKSWLEIPKPERIELRDPGRHKINRRIFIPFWRPTTPSSVSFPLVLLLYFHPLSSVSRVNWSLGLMAASTTAWWILYFSSPPPLFFFARYWNILSIWCCFFVFVCRVVLIPVFVRFVIPLQSFFCFFEIDGDGMRFSFANSLINYDRPESVL